MGLTGEVCRLCLLAHVLQFPCCQQTHGRERWRVWPAGTVLQGIPARHAGLEPAALGLLAWPSLPKMEKTSPHLPTDFINNFFWQNGQTWCRSRENDRPRSRMESPPPLQATFPCSERPPLPHRGVHAGPELPSAPVASASPAPRPTFFYNGQASLVTITTPPIQQKVSPARCCPSQAPSVGPEGGGLGVESRAGRRPGVCGGRAGVAGLGWAPDWGPHGGLACDPAWVNQTLRRHGGHSCKHPADTLLHGERSIPI